MKIHYGFEEVGHIRNAVVTTGSFDGVHLGHQVILKKLIQLAAEENGESVLITFYPHPRLVLYPDSSGKDLLMINTRKEKILLLEKAGLDHVIFVKFTREFSETSSVEFVKEYLINKLHTRKIVTGENHHFGKNRTGDIEELRQLGALNNFDLELIPHQDIQNVDISSTLIRESIIRGKIEKANTYLTHPYYIIGYLKEGSQSIKKQGYTTYTIEIEEKNKLLPPCGSYLVDVMENKIIKKGIALISKCSNSLSDSILDIYINGKITHFNKEIVLLFTREINVLDDDKKGSLLNSIMMKDLTRFANNE